MPKILIREFDNSKALVTPSNNFSVVVPGFIGTGTATDEERKAAYLGYDVYELKTQADFEKYIGEYTENYTGETTVAQRPTPTVLIPSGTGLAKFARKMTLEDFESDKIKSEGKIYKIEEVQSTDTEYGKNGYLLYTEGTTTYKFILVENPSDIEKANGFEVVTDSGDKETVRTKDSTYCKIKVGSEGRNAWTVFDEDPHYGNQIAYNLLGVGYTVLYKVLDNSRPSKEQLKADSFWEPLKDKSIFNFRYLISGGCYDKEVMNQMVRIASFDNGVDLAQAEIIGGEANGRGDCIALCDIDESYDDGTCRINSSDTMENIVKGLAKAASGITANKNAAIFGPRVQYVGDDLVYPASYHYLLCAANSQQRYAE
jgi:hypothetical protein